MAALSWKCKFRGGQFLYNFNLGLRGGHTEQGVCHNVALAFTLQKYLKAKEEELWKLKYFIMQKSNLQTNPLKETKILQDIL